MQVGGLIYQCNSIDTTLEVVGFMAHPLASIMGDIIYIIWEVLDLMVHPLALIAALKLQDHNLDKQETHDAS